MGNRTFIAAPAPVNVIAVMLRFWFGIGLLPCAVGMMLGIWQAWIFGMLFIIVGLGKLR
jgi:hypothetical protein